MKAYNQENGEVEEYEDLQRVRNELGIQYLQALDDLHLSPEMIPEDLTGCKNLVIILFQNLYNKIIDRLTGEQ